MKKCALIINPCSGQKKVFKDTLKISNLLTENDYLPVFHFTSYHKHAELIASQCEGYDLIICSGGDGTLKQVITGLCNANINVPIGYIPAGSTNDFANTLSLSHDHMKATEQIIHGSNMPCDIGMFNNEYFIYIASFGLFTSASYNTPQEAKNALGPLAYFFSGFKELLNAKTYHVSIQTPTDSTEGDYILGMVSNTLSIGGVMKLSPEEVDLNDGLFEVILVKQPQTLDDCAELFDGLVNKSFSNNMFDYFKAEDLIIKTEEPLVWSLDGEESDATCEVKIKNIHSKITIKK